MIIHAPVLCENKDCFWITRTCSPEGISRNERDQSGPMQINAEGRCANIEPKTREKDEDKDEAGKYKDFGHSI